MHSFNKRIALGGTLSPFFFLTIDKKHRTSRNANQVLPHILLDHISGKVLLHFFHVLMQTKTKKQKEALADGRGITIFFSPIKWGNNNNNNNNYYYYYYHHHHLFATSSN